jgi:beta-fructofuranosidase
VSRDPQRPHYHFLPPANWMNDPNGLIQWGDTYHLFYQYNPNGPFHGTIHWGHATSKDLVHWQHEPIALAPDPDGPDAEGCWSGYAVDNNGVPTLIYSGHRNDQQLPCLATSDDSLRTWQKHPANPLFAERPTAPPLTAMRDHTLWREGEQWHMLMGAGVRDEGGAMLHFCSPDLLDWQYLGPLLSAPELRNFPLWTGVIWECPDFFPLEDQQVLVFSICDMNGPHSNAVCSGSYVDGRFEPETLQRLDYGERYFYAPLSFLSKSGRRIIFGWIPEGRSAAAQQAAGWSGVMSLPREMFINRAGMVAMRPIAELQGLRSDHQAWAGLAIPAEQVTHLHEQAGDRLECVIELNPSRQGSCGVLLRRSPNGEEETRISYNLELGQLVLNRMQSSLDGEVERESQAAPLALAAGEPLRLQVFLDNSVIEVFANDQISLTSRIYPTRADSLGLALFAEQSDAWALRVDLFRLQGIGV